jgi:hypothetical protein
VDFNISNEMTMKDLMNALDKLYEKTSTSNKVFLMKRPFNMKMSEGGFVVNHLYEFNTVTNQLSSVKCWVCVIFFVLYSFLGFVSVFGRSSIFVSIYGRFFGTWFFVDGFLFLVKELGLLTNPGHWIRVLDIVGSYMYIL